MVILNRNYQNSGWQTDKNHRCIFCWGRTIHEYQPQYSTVDQEVSEISLAIGGDVWFDNFRVTTVPLPTALWLFSTG